MTASAPCLIYVILVSTLLNATDVEERTTAYTMPVPMPEPPPVQKRTLPLKISGLNVVVDSTTGATKAFWDMLNIDGWG
jgi:hypothetical protein